MRVLIVEDERQAAELLAEMIGNFPGCEVVEMLESIEEAVEYLKAYQDKLDLIFMDIQLADGQSFHVFERVEVKLPVIFCTAYDEYVLKAFKHNGVDYILKPLNEKDVCQALEKVVNLKKVLTGKLEADYRSLLPLLKPPVTFQQSFLVHFRDKMIPVAVREIALIHLRNEVVYLHTADGQKYPIFKRLDEMEAVLNPGEFFRVNRQMIVKRGAIREIEPYFNRKLSVHLSVDADERIVVSRLKVPAFLDWIEKSV